MKGRRCVVFTVMLWFFVSGSAAGAPLPSSIPGSGPLPPVQERKAIDRWENEPVYGREVMTEQELEDYREALNALGSGEEKERFRREHQTKMRKRARLLGISISGDQPEDRSW